MNAPQRAGLDWWLARDKTRGAEEAAEASWNSWKDLHRANISVALSILAPFESLYEVGCQSGPNLRLAKQLYPDLRIGGSEPCAIPAALASERLGCKIDHHVLPDMTDESFDIVLSAYVLCHLNPDQIGTAMFRMTRVARRAVIVFEPVAWAELLPGQCRSDHMIEWRHNYHAIFPALGWRIAWAWPLIPAAMNANALIIAIPNEEGA